MAKTQRVGLVQVDVAEPATRSKERTALAAVIAKIAEMRVALAENEARQRKTREAVAAVNDAIDAATKAVDAAKDADADAIARTGAGANALRNARRVLQDAEDELESAQHAQKILRIEREAISTYLSPGGDAKTEIDTAVAAVVSASPELLTLIEVFSSAQRKFYELHRAMREVPAKPDELKYWDSQFLPDHSETERKFGPSAPAAAVKAWVTKLHQDADAQLELD